MAQSQTVVRVANASAQVLGGNAFGVRLEPLTNAVSGNPVRLGVALRFDKDRTRELHLSDDGALYFAERFALVELVGGVLGDRWRVTLYTTPHDRHGQATQRVARSPIVVAKLEWTPEDQVSGLVKYLTGASGESTGGALAETWLDVSAYESLVFAVRADDANGDDANGGEGYTFTPFLTFAADPGGRAQMETVAGPDLRVGTDPEEAHQWLVSIGAGAPPAGTDAVVRTTVPRAYPYVRVGYSFGPGSTGGEFVGHVVLSGRPRG